MCDKRYDLDCLDGIDDNLQTSAKQSACGRAIKPQKTHNNNNNNTQLLSCQQPEEPQQLQQQNKQLQLVSSRPAGESAARHADGESEKVGNPISAEPQSSPIISRHYHQVDSPRSLPSSLDQTATIETSSMSSGQNADLVTCMLITANVGTIFEESTLLERWFEQLKSYLIKIKPQLVAIHCQEVGGKNYETSMKNVSLFTDKILGDDKIIGDYSRVRIFLDENFECLEKFTALGSLYLVHDSVKSVKLYNFKTAQYDNIEGRSIQAAPDKRDLLGQQQADTNEQGAPNKLAEHVEKIKFPLELFPECRWSRKGFMRTRWLFNDCQPLDLVNIHLFHDASNLVAMKTTPSPYAQNRQKALEFALMKLSEPLQRTETNQRGQLSQNLNNTTSSTQPSSFSEQQRQDPQVPLFIFGDFNFRLNTSKVIQRITEGISPVVKRNANSDEVLEFVYHRKMSDCVQDSARDECQAGSEATTKTNDAGEDDGNEVEVDGCGVVMTVGKKLFDYENLDETFRATKNTEWLLELDNELDSFRSQLYEFKISFSPSYPFKEDESGGYSYMKTRCPAWCDRILFNEAGYQVISGKSDANLVSEKRIELLQDQGDVIYRLMGNSVPMGDHKPVLLYCHLNLSQKRHLQHQNQQQSNQNPSSKCNQAVTTGGSSTIEDNLLESTAM